MILKYTKHKDGSVWRVAIMKEKGKFIGKRITEANTAEFIVKEVLKEDDRKRKTRMFPPGSSVNGRGDRYVLV